MGVIPETKFIINIINPPITELIPPITPAIVANQRIHLHKNIYIDIPSKRKV